jgi:hypothetical protein
MANRLAGKNLPPAKVGIFMELVFAQPGIFNELSMLIVNVIRVEPRSGESDSDQFLTSSLIYLTFL